MPRTAFRATRSGRAGHPARTVRGTALAVCAAAAAALALTVSPAGAAPAEPEPQIYAPPSPAPQTAPSPQAHRHTGPEIHRFLTWFYGAHGPTAQQRERYVSDFLKKKQHQHPDHDVILCAQNTPQRVAVGPVTVAQSAGSGWATVTAYWADGTTSTSTAYVALDSHPIELHDVECAVH